MFLQMVLFHSFLGWIIFHCKYAYIYAKADVIFIIGEWNAKVGSQEIPGVTGKFGLEIQSETGQRLTEFCQENEVVIANILFQKHKRRLYIWTSPDDQHQYLIIFFFQPRMEKLYTVSKNKTGTWLWLRSWAPYCQIQTENEKKWRKPLDHSGMT